MVRIQARVEDVHTRSCLWAERYDTAPHELFAVEDLVSTNIVSTVYSLLVARIGLQLGRPTEPALQPWMLAHEGMILREARSNSEALARLQAALQHEPDLVLAHFGLGLVYYDPVPSRTFFLPLASLS